MSSVDFFLSSGGRKAPDALVDRQSASAPPEPFAVSSQSGLPLFRNGAEPVAILANASHRRRIRIKRVFDLLVSGLALIGLAPLLLFVALAVRASGAGPILFRQVRQGIDGQSFSVFKFRTMRSDDCDVSGVNQTAQNDPRVTPIGRFLRRTSIDELPQLLNVLRGEMSLVGPRPHVEGMQAGGMEYGKLVPYYHQRLSMPPGITGWAQANGLRGPTRDAALAQARIDHDIAYIQNFSIWIDIVILVRTVWREFLVGSGK